MAIGGGEPSRLSRLSHAPTCRRVDAPTCGAQGRRRSAGSQKEGHGRGRGLVWGRLQRRYGRNEPLNPGWSPGRPPPTNAPTRLPPPLCFRFKRTISQAETARRRPQGSRAAAAPLGALAADPWSQSDHQPARDHHVVGDDETCCGCTAGHSGSVGDKPRFAALHQDEVGHHPAGMLTRDISPITHGPSARPSERGGIIN